MSEDRRLDLEEIRALIRLATEAEITELAVDAPHVKVRIRKAARADAAGRPAGTAPAVPAPLSGEPSEEPSTGYIPIVAPMVGTFYRAPKPDAAPYVEEGSTIEAGQTVCILEAMKLFNEIPSEVAGRIARILVENGAPVEYGQALFLVDPIP